ncbi:MAG: enoyl-CoA hydratase/isomerase family protein [Flavobacterium sp.]|nr:enoyl-CoA hydratase/isomerase family protein [Flavobacterium sp.]
MTNVNDKGSIVTEINSKIATITFSHPASNSFPSALLQKLVLEFNQLSSKKDINIIVLQSSGTGAFCSGASFDELLSITDFETGKTFFQGFANVINAMRKCSKIIVGKVQGKAVGGGVGLISACDYAIANKESSVKLSEITIGIGPFVIEPAVSRKIGVSAFSNMTFTPTQWKTASWAFDKGLYDMVCDTQQHLDLEVDVFTKNLSNYNPEALLELKKVLWKNTENWDELLIERASISGKLVLSKFTKNALNQFKK